MNKIILSTTVATLAIMSAYAAFAQSGPYYEYYGAPATEVVAPGGATVVTSGRSTVVPPGSTAIITTPSSAYYVPAGYPANQPVTLGQMIASHIKDPALDNFKTALLNTSIPENFDTDKGYTVFAPKNYNGKYPVDHYIVNDRISMNSLQTKVTQDHVTNLRGENLRVSRVGQSYFVNNMRVNDVNRNPEGAIYTVGGNSDAPQLQ